MVTVELEEVVSISYLQLRSTDELMVQWLKHLTRNLIQRIFRIAQQDLFLELICGSLGLDVANSALIAVEAVVHVLVVAEWRRKYKTSMPVG